MEKSGKHASVTRRQELTIGDIEVQSKSLTALALQLEYIVTEGKSLKDTKFTVDGATKFDRHLKGLSQYARNVLSGISMAKIENVVRGDR